MAPSTSPRFRRSRRSSTDADAEVTAAAQRISGIDPNPLAGPVARAVGSLQTKLVNLGSTTDTAARIGRLAPALLGADGPKKYLVVFQNLAEARATGGIFGSYALLQVDNGKLKITDQGASSRDLGTFDPPLPTPPNLPAVLYGNLPQTYATDVNLTPDFPTAARLVRQDVRNPQTRRGRRGSGNRPGSALVSAGWFRARRDRQRIAS